MKSRVQAIEEKKRECTVSVIKCEVHWPSSSVVCYPIMVAVLDRVFQLITNNFVECFFIHVVHVNSTLNYSVVWLVANPMKNPASAWPIITWLDISA